MAGVKSSPRQSWQSAVNAAIAQLRSQLASDGGGGGSPGPTGPAGPTGETGPQGPAGVTGQTKAYKSADQTAIGTAYANVTDLSFSVGANKAYAFEFNLLCTADAATTGIDVAVNGPASPTSIVYQQIYWTSTTARTERGAIAYDSNTASTASNGTAARVFTVRGVLRNGANAGTLVARAKRENVGSGPNVLAGSYAILTELG